MTNKQINDKLYVKLVGFYNEFQNKHHKNESFKCVIIDALTDLVGFAIASLTSYCKYYIDCFVNLCSSIIANLISFCDIIVAFPKAGAEWQAQYLNEPGSSWAPSAMTL